MTKEQNRAKKAAQKIFEILDTQDKKQIPWILSELLKGFDYDGLAELVGMNRDVAVVTGEFKELEFTEMPESGGVVTLSALTRMFEYLVPGVRIGEIARASKKKKLIWWVEDMRKTKENITLLWSWSDETDQKGADQNETA